MISKMILTISGSTNNVRMYLYLCLEILLVCSQIKGNLYFTAANISQLLMPWLVVGFQSNLQLALLPKRSKDILIFGHMTTLQCFYKKRSVNLSRAISHFSFLPVQPSAAQFFPPNLKYGALVPLVSVVQSIEPMPVFLSTCF